MSATTTKAAPAGASGDTAAAGTSTYFRTPRRSIFAMIAVAAAGALAIVGVFLLAVLLVVMPLLTSASRLVSHLPVDPAGYYARVQMQMQQLTATPPASTQP